MHVLNDQSDFIKNTSLTNSVNSQQPKTCVGPSERKPLEQLKINNSQRNQVKQSLDQKTLQTIVRLQNNPSSTQGHSQQSLETITFGENDFTKAKKHKENHNTLPKQQVIFNNKPVSLANNTDIHYFTSTSIVPKQKQQTGKPLQKLNILESSPSQFSGFTSTSMSVSETHLQTSISEDDRHKRH